MPAPCSPVPPPAAPLMLAPPLSEEEIQVLLTAAFSIAACASGSSPSGPACCTRETVEPGATTVASPLIVFMPDCAPPTSALPEAPP